LSEGIGAFADAAPQAAARLRAWLDAGHHGDMLWMESRADERASPRGPDARPSGQTAPVRVHTCLQDRSSLCPFILA
jgi:hypothetical protein